jgi:hypothetical protein
MVAIKQTGGKQMTLEAQKKVVRENSPRWSLEDKEWLESTVAYLKLTEKPEIAAMLQLEIDKLQPKQGTKTSYFSWENYQQGFYELQGGNGMITALNRFIWHKKKRLEIQLQRDIEQGHTTSNYLLGQLVVLSELRTFIETTDEVITV